MKILYHHRIASKDGQYVHVEEICNAFRNLGHKVAVVGPNSINHGSMGKESWLIQFMKKYLPGQIYEILEIGYSLIAYYRLRAQASDLKPDFIYERYSLFMLAGVWLKKGKKIPYALEINSPLVEERSRFGGLKLRRLAKRLQCYVWRQADFVFPVTEVLANIVEGEGVPRERIRVLHNGANLDRVTGALSSLEAKRRLGLQGKTVLGFVGFVREWHSLERVIAIFDEVKYKEDIHLLIIGDGPALGELREEVRARNIETNVTFVGTIAKEAVLDFIAAFDIALQPAVVGYASPLKLFDYMAMGKAIVAPNSKNILEILRHEHDGLLFDQKNEREFQDAVIRLIDDSDLRVRLGTNAKLTLKRRRFSWQENAREICAIAGANEIKPRLY